MKEPLMKIAVKIRTANGTYKQRQYDVPIIHDDFGVLAINEYNKLIFKKANDEFPMSRVIWWSFKQETLYK